MNLKELGEFGFIDRIGAGCMVRPDRVARAIGDDAAAIHADTERLLLVTTDMLVERVHFLKEATTGLNLGHKAIAVNLSDIAAMGGTAREAFVSLAIPDDLDLEWLDELYCGMKALAARFDVNIVGGDTTGSKTDLIINITVTGSVRENEILYRNTARSGDLICIIGTVGDSRAGLHMILEHIEADTDELKHLLNAHLLPWPRLREGRFLARHGGVTAAIDVSDGLSSDLGHIVRQSGLGARIYAEKIPISNPMAAFCSRFGFDPLEYAICGGEDYTLLFTVSPDQAGHLEQAYSREFGEAIHAIGHVTDSKTMEIVSKDGEINPLELSGWNHFR